jgi:hypothetical protein
MKARICVLATVIYALLANAAHATVFPLLGLDQMIEEAEQIVAGEVLKVESQWSEDRTTIYTFVTLGDLQVIHGQVEGDALVLRFEGGEVDGFRITVHGSPSFRPGERDFLFIRGNGFAVSPLVGFVQGRFKVVDGQIYDYAGVPIVEIRGDAFVKVLERPSGIGDSTQNATPSPEITAGNPVGGIYPYREGAGEGTAGAREEQPGAGVGAPQTDVFPPPTPEASREPDTPRVSPPVALPPPPEQGQVHIMIEPEQASGKRLSVDEFTRIVQDRLGI